MREREKIKKINNREKFRKWEKIILRFPLSVRSKIPSSEGWKIFFRIIGWKKFSLIKNVDRQSGIRCFMWDTNNRCVMESLVLFRFGMWKRFFDVKKFTIKYEKLDLVQTEEKKEFCCKFSTYHNGGKCLNIYAKCFSPQIASEKCSWHFIDFSIFFFKPNDTASRVEKISNWVRKKFCW